jgi:hypothetical protein
MSHIFTVLIICMAAAASSLPQYDDFDGGFGGGYDGGFGGSFGGGLWGSFGGTSEVDTIQRLPFEGGFGGGYGGGFGGGYGGTSEIDTIQRLPFGGLIEEDVFTRRLPGGSFETEDRIIERLPLGLGTFEWDTITRTRKIFLRTKGTLKSSERSL